jgi:putative endopeptidase
MQLMKKLVLGGAIVACGTFGLNVEAQAASKEQKPLELSNFDNSIKPGNDFFRYTNGGWMKNNPIPPAYSRWGSFNILQENNNDNLKTIVEAAALKPGKKGEENQKIGDFFYAAMDSTAIEKAGTAPLKPYFAKIDAIKNKKDLMKVVAEFHAMGLAPIFAFYAGQDEKNSSMVIAQLAQAGIGMGNRDYYTDETPRAKELRQKYVEHLSNMFNLINVDKKASNEVMDLETKLAQTSMTLVEQRDPLVTYNAVNVKELQEMCPAVDWKAYFKALGLKKDPSKINVTSVKFFKGISSIIENTSIDTWKEYLKWNIAHVAASYLSSSFVNESFNFYGKALSGSKELQPRWKRALNATNEALGEAVGKIYCKQFFPPEAKTRMVKLVENLRGALDERISKLTWMSAPTKAKAREKLKAMNVKIGYPDAWRSYAKLNISRDKSYFENAMDASKFDFDFMIAKIDKKHDKKEWGMTPQTVNAYYSPNSNEIVFPAAILQPPFFFLHGDDAINYGGIGGVIGHEMTHGFDDQGRQYDKEGNLNDWWTADDAKNFENQTKVLVNQFNNFELLGEKVNGELTLGENIADLGGITVAYTALQKALKGQNVDKIDGFTPLQRLMLSWSQVWRTNVRDEETKRRLKEDVHSPAEARVNGLMPNLPFFYEAFDIKPGDKLYRAPADRAVIW